MQLEIGQVRERLPELLQQIETKKDLRIEILVAGKVVAELRSTAQPSNAAAENLRNVMAALPAHEGPRRNISGRVGEALYSPDPE